MAPILPPGGIMPVDQYNGNGLSARRTDDKKSLMIYPDLYRLQSDPKYEDPKDSAHDWQNPGDPMDQLSWLRIIHEIIGRVSRIRIHVYRSLWIKNQTETEFPVVDFIEKDDLYSFLRANPHHEVPTGRGSENQSLVSQTQMALNVTTALAFLRKEDIILWGLSPNTVHLRSDLSASLVNLDVAAHKARTCSDSIGDSYRSPEWLEEPFPNQPETWIISSQDIYASGSLLHYLLNEEDHGLWEEEEDMPDLDDNNPNELVKNCWTREFHSMD
ncbi:uncharacterized protein RAG0_12027 [Rhynchosporium agropyri]|uniref:Protein kinase domain-containing protein n=1 Tax=Rhynchosporium agropyri TaxID=914238 RepID=A0A1E1L6S6_9HELO|nr:uncharacterized protein RAG0_12027 [Rhynchosporium agropyri]